MSDWADLCRQQRYALLCAFLFVLVVVAYGSSLQLPFLSDDYVQIRLARIYGPPAGWPSLMKDPLYRCRSVSLVHTWLTEQWFGLNPLAFHIASVFLHFLNCLLVAGLGIWRKVGWSVSVPASAFFAVFERPQEAVIWHAASPELEVFAFAILNILIWTVWVQDREQFRKPAHRLVLMSGFLLSFFFALLSKESGAILPVLLLVVLVVEGEKDRRSYLPLLPLFGVSIAYFLAGYVSKSDHLHYNDGTFSLTAPFWYTLPASLVRLLGIWGLAAVALLLFLRRATFLQPALACLAFAAVALVPYSFVAYMPRVPSRHTYMASAAVAILIGFAASSLWNSFWPKRKLALLAIASTVLLSNIGYLWAWKMPQYWRRAAPTEELVQRIRDGRKPVKVLCFPYSAYTAESAVLIAGGQSSDLTMNIRKACPPDDAEFADSGER
ncbi:MAG: hypothetical protein H7039_08475 [Bryobacteraceae bacterium]|nr:hypothetical protein [Bryobacteraceae bacterium]